MIVGGLGSDLIDGGTGNDTIWGGVSERADATWTSTFTSDFSWWTSKFDLTNAANFSLPLGFSAAESYAVTTLSRTAYAAPRLTPLSLVSRSVDGAADGRDVLNGGDDTDWIFGGGESDLIDSGTGDDYVDGGAGDDVLRGGDGDDVIRGGQNNDTVRGGAGIDQVYGEQGDDLLFGDAGTSGNQAGQRLWGGSGVDTLYAFAPTSNSTTESALFGDELNGGSDGDLLYGNLRRELLIGDSVTETLSGADYIHGDYLSGPMYARSTDAGRLGGGDVLLGGFGSDQIFGGGGPDRLYGGPDSDFLEGMDGQDEVYGGAAADILVLDVDSRYAQLGDTFNGFGFNRPGDTTGSDDAVDILLIEGDKSYNGNVPVLNDRISLNEITDAGKKKLQVQYTPTTSTGAVRNIIVDWRSSTPQQLPLVEQIQVAGLMGDDTIEMNLDQSTIDQLALLPGSDWVSVINGGPGNDILGGTLGRDRINGGSGSDYIFGFAGSDRLWGDFFDGNPDQDTDVLFGGADNDDLIGGQGANELYAWTYHPNSAVRPTTVTTNVTQFFDASRQLRLDSTRPFGVFDASGKLEQTGLNRMLGSDNDSRSDKLYGGTGLDLLYGNGGGGATGDQLYTRTGVLFENSDGNDASGDDSWKEYARSQSNVWYLSGSENADTVNVDFITNPYNPLYGRHVVSFSSAGSFDPRFSGFDTFTAFNTSGPVHSPTDGVFDAEGVLLDRETGQLRTDRSAYNVFQSFGISTTDIVNRVFGPEPKFDAIIIDTLGGTDNVTVGETVQKTVWVDGGLGDDTLIIQPQRSFLPDLTDGFGNRNDTAPEAFSLGLISGSVLFDGFDAGQRSPC